jgi:hypothetical protein
MNVISIDVAIQHLRADDDDPAFIQGLLDAAEGAAADYMNRNFYADQEQLDAARASVLDLRLNARAAYTAAMETAGLVQDVDSSTAAANDAERAFKEAFSQATAIARGIVLNRTIQAACLLILGHLYTNREDVITSYGAASAAEIPMGSRYLLNPYRVGMGV